VRLKVVFKMMKKIILISLLLLIIFSGVEAKKVCVYYFYGIGCPHCANVKPLLDELENKYTDLELHRLEIYQNKTNREFFDKFCSEYKIEKRGVPLVVIGDKYIMGDKPIIENLENEILKLLPEGAECPKPQSYEDIIDGNETSISPIEKKNLNISIIITAALTDGINPCAFSVLIFLLTYLLSIGRRKRILIIGFSYILAVYISYFAAGFGLLTIIQIAGITRIIYKTAAFIAIFVGLFNIKDFFWYGKGLSFKIPEVSKGTIEKYTRMATLPSAIILGFLVSSVELPCTGGVYLAILGMLADQVTKLQAIPYLLLYNFVFILPLIAIIIVVYFGIPPEKTEKWRESNKKWMKLFSGLLMAVLGIWMLVK